MNEEMIGRIVENVLKKSAGLSEKQEMSLKLAEALSKRVEEKAKEMGIAVVIAVVDRAARPVLVHCMDGAYIASFDIALNKAYTSAGLKMSTAELGALSGPGGPLYGIQNTGGGRIVIFGGGETLSKNGELIGAFGVSGGTLEQDTGLAAYGGGIFEDLE